jgi:FAD/FMN-containing dehydrogenase/pimeloyl-ACP methyl ester carboxylesterase
VKGRVIGPGDVDYDEARKVFYGGPDRKPAAIVRVVGSSDVARVLTFARERGVELAVRSGGHSVARHSVVNGGIVLDLGEMKGLAIDPEGHSAWAETGLTAGEYTTATAAYGLATGFGDTGSVGIGGITLAGGIGFLVRKNGMTIDNLLAAELVTADGRTLHADAESHPDLFWALRGGGGNFGVATRLKFRLHEIDRIYGGMLCMPATVDTIVSLVEKMATSPDELSAMVNVMKAPPMPFIPEEHHGRPLVMVLVAHCGEIGEGEQFVDRLRKISPPIVDMARPMRYVESFPPEQNEFHPVAANRTMFAESIGRDEALSIIEHLEASSAFMALAHLRALGGAMGRVPNDATAFAHRDRSLLVNVTALYESADQQAEHEAWVADLSGMITGVPGAYAGFLGGDGLARINEAYPASTWMRLVDVKKRYDPDNVFRLNHNILPSATGVLGLQGIRSTGWGRSRRAQRSNVMNDRLEIRPFRIDVPQGEVDDLTDRLVRTRWPHEVRGADWSRGVPLDYLKELTRYWATGFDWRKQEAQLNEVPQFVTSIDGQCIHFLHVRSRHPQALPLILTHGWPSTPVEFLKVIGPLTDPTAFGGDANDAFHIVAPSLPGYGFSTPVSGQGWGNLFRVAQAWSTLMANLGYGRYAVHGTDVGAGVAGMLAIIDADKVKGTHITGTTAAMPFGPPIDLEGLSDRDRARGERFNRYQAEQLGYLHMQATRPQTLSYSLNDSPTGQLAWIVEKFHEWTDPSARLPEDAVDRDQLLTNVSIFWFTGSGASSAHATFEGMQAYREMVARQGDGQDAHQDDPTGPPMGVAVFAADTGIRSLLDPNNAFARWSEFDRGGHFPAMEVPELLTNDLVAFCRQLR